MGFHVLVLAGGSGTRLWPLSRASVPKHLLPIGRDGASLLRTTVERVLPVADRVHLVTAADQADACLEALGELRGAVSVIAEPRARGTGPALGLAVHRIASVDVDAVIASVHADHHVGDDDAYRAALVAAAGWAATTSGLAAVGLTPTRAATGFGYIELDGELDVAGWSAPAGTIADSVILTAAAALPAYHADGFVEKPPLETAESFIAGGRHVWNLGLFAWTARSFLAELAAADGTLDAVLRNVAAALATGRDAEAESLYEALAPVAVEPLVFERTEHLSVVRAGFEWSDLGTWADLAASKASVADADGNIMEGDALVMGSRECLVEAQAGRLVVVLGGEALVVIDTGNAVLVMPATSSQDVKRVVERLRDAGRGDLL